MPIIDDTTWLTARIEAAQGLVVAYEDAIAALLAGAASYSLDTGQTRQTVTRHNLTSMRDALASAENRLATLKVRLNGGGTHVVPGF